MDKNELYKYVRSQLDAGKSIPVIAEEITYLTSINQEDATQYVDSIQNEKTSNESKETTHPKPITKLKSKAQEYFELVLSAVIIAVAFGIYISGGRDSFSDIPTLIEISFASLLGVSTGFVIHELGHRMTARKYGYIASFSMWIPGLILALVTSFFSWIFAAPGAVVIRNREGIIEENKGFVKELGKISLAGPITNVCLAIVFLLLSYLYTLTDGFGTYSSTLSLILVIGADINSILAAFNLLPFGPFDGRKIFKWNKMIWFGAAAIAVGLFFFIQSPLSSLENINAPKTPTSYKLYTDPGGRYSFNYPANWIQITEGSKSELATFFNNLEDAVLFCEKREAVLIAVESIDLSKDYSDVSIDEMMLSNIVEDYIETLSLPPIEKNKRLIDPLAEKGFRIAYELKFKDNPNNVSAISTFTWSDKCIYGLFFVCSTDYYDSMLPAYDYFINSIRFR